MFVIAIKLKDIYEIYRQRDVEHNFDNINDYLPRSYHIVRQAPGMIIIGLANLSVHNIASALVGIPKTPALANCNHH